jgi:hypothetical protein
LRLSQDTEFDLYLLDDRLGTATDSTFERSCENFILPRLLCFALAIPTLQTKSNGYARMAMTTFSSQPYEQAR